MLSQCSFRRKRLVGWRPPAPIPRKGYSVQTIIPISYVSSCNLLFLHTEYKIRVKKYGKKRLREIDRRIRFLTKRLESAEVVDPTQQKNRDRVFFGATVTYAREDGTENTVTIVGADEVDLDRARVSWISPIARALLKAQEGDVVDLRTPNGVEQIEVIEIKYPGDE